MRGHRWIVAVIAAGLAATGSASSLSGGGAAEALAAPAGATSGSFRVVVRLETAYTAGPFSGRATTTADVTARGGPTDYAGRAEATFEGVQYHSQVEDCTLTPTRGRGGIDVAIQRVGADQIRVTLAGDAASWGHLHCETTSGVVDDESAVIEPLLSTAPKTFTLPAEGGTQPISGEYAVGAGRDVTTGTVTVAANVCDNPATAVTKVTTRSGRPSSLGSLAGSGLQPGQRITADQDVELEFGDGSVVRLLKGSSYALTDCTPAAPQQPFKVKASLVLGHMWAKVTKALGSDRLQIAHECQRGQFRCVVGVRGTIFSISVRAGVRTIRVYEGSVWLQRQQGSRLVGRRWLVRAGQTATWGKGTPTIRRSPTTSARPTWRFGPESGH